MKDITLISRKNYPSSEIFRHEFLNSITPGVIERKDFIKWETIKVKTKKFEQFFDFFDQLKDLKKEDYIQTFGDSLMSADVAMDFVSTAFELLGHTGDNYVSNKDYLIFKIFAETEKTDEGMRYIAELLYDLGLPKIDNRMLTDYFTGIQVGLETHRRKNVGGTAFSNIMKKELDNVVESLIDKGLDVTLDKEVKVYYSDGKTSKTVDFCLKSGTKKIGVEINFYTSSGSKPTEIKRSYGQINLELAKVGTLLAWVTDGAGYDKMKKSLKEARDIHKNIYNLEMFKESFMDDAYKYFTEV